MSQFCPVRYSSPGERAGCMQRDDMYQRRKNTTMRFLNGKWRWAQVNGIIDRSKKDLTIMGHPLARLVEQFGLPLHLIYGPAIRDNIRAFRAVFAHYYPHGIIRYAAKACTHPAVFDIVKKEGAGADVISPFEMECALEAGIPPTDLDLNGNCKEDSLIERAIGANTLIVADSLEEFDVIARIARNNDRKARVLLRISGFELGPVTSEDIFTAGTWSKFGAPLKDIPLFIQSLSAYPQVEFLGWHTHIGSQITDPEPYGAVLGTLIELGIMLKKVIGHCALINIGGGWPVSYLGEHRWNVLLDRVARGYNMARQGDMSGVYAWANHCGGFERGDDGSIDENHWRGEKFYTPFPKADMLKALLTGTITVNGRSTGTVDALHMLGDPALVIEPGRSIVEDAGVTLARVGYVRKIGEHHNLISMEMGVMSHCSSLLEGIPSQWEIANDFRRQEPVPWETFIAGNLCFSGDMLSKYKIPLQRKPVRGDILVIHCTGAYTSQFMASNANSFPRPLRAIVDEKGNIDLMKKRDSYRELFPP